MRGKFTIPAYKYRSNNTTVEIMLPDAHEMLMDGVVWGTPYEVPSAAYWAFLFAERAEEPDFQARSVGNSLLEQAAFCLLGGYGMPAEMGIAAFESVRGAGLLRGGTSETEIEAILREPLRLGEQERRYRFPRQKARYLAATIEALSRPIPGGSPLELREFLRALPGVGYKTASWVVRDWMASDEVAIIDIHIERACRAIGVFGADQRLPGDYLEMEQRFLRFAREIGCRPSVLDNLMWSVMRSEGSVLGVA